MSDTPRTDEAQFMPSEQPPAFNLAQYMVKAGFAQTLERENAALRGQLQKETQRRFDGNEIASKEHREEVAALRDVLSRLIKVHDAMGGKCDTVRIAAEEALLGKAQSEYICTCGIRVTPHKCPTNNGF